MDNSIEKNITLNFISLRQLLCITSFMLMILLSSCSHMVARKDGPPNFYVDVSRIPNATPRPESHSKYGNLPTYTVFGQRYHTMRSSKNYQAIGVASWYGTKFHKRHTSNGETYDMLAMTAAHKTLPLPTYVEVTNLSNHRQVVVKVNDRGPFEGNRLIDLSYVAAKKLGMLGHGTAQVKVKAIDPIKYNRAIALVENKRRRHAAENQQDNPYHDFWITENTRSQVHQHKFIKNQPIYLQVGAFRNKAFAEKLQTRLMTMVSFAPIKITPSGKTKLYHVQIGPIKDVATANKITHQLRIVGIKSNKV